MRVGFHSSGRLLLSTILELTKVSELKMQDLPHKLGSLIAPQTGSWISFGRSARLDSNGLPDLFIESLEGELLITWDANQHL